MPETRRAKSKKHKKTDKKGRSTRSNTSELDESTHRTVANVNSNHSQESDRSQTITPIKITVKQTPKVKSKVVKVHQEQSEDKVDYMDDIDTEVNAQTTQFEESGDVVQMQISDTAAREFESEIGSEDNSSDSENEGLEKGEIPESENEMSSQPESSGNTPQKGRKKKSKRQSIEEMEGKIDSLSSAFFEMKDIMKRVAQKEEQPERKNTEQTRKRKIPGKDVAMTISNSDTTIYQNVLDKVNQPEFMAVDSEIEFRSHNQVANAERRESSSSEDKIDTSDELMEVGVGVDFNERFIADCAREAANSKRTSLHEDTLQEIADRSREVEASKASMMATPGEIFQPQVMPLQEVGFGNAVNYSSHVDENYLVIGAHVDLSLKEKIKRGEYVDFARLLLVNAYLPVKGEWNW